MGQEELRRTASEWLGRDQTVATEASPDAIWARRLCSDDKGRWRRSEDKAMRDSATTALQVNATTGNGV